MKLSYIANLVYELLWFHYKSALTDLCWTLVGCVQAKIMCMYDGCICTYLAGDTGNPLANKWLTSESCRLLIVKLNPLLEKAIDQPDAIAPKYATNPLTQVN